MSKKIKVTLESFIGAMVALADENPGKRYIPPGATEPAKWGDGCFNFHPPLGWKDGDGLSSEELFGSEEGEKGTENEFHPSRSEWTPGCIVGSAYVKVTGLSASALMMRGVSNEGGTGTTFLQMDSIWKFPGHHEHRLAEEFAAAAQLKQDHGETWGEAVKHGMRRVEEVVSAVPDRYEHLDERVKALRETILPV